MTISRSLQEAYSQTWIEVFAPEKKLLWTPFLSPEIPDSLAPFFHVITAWNPRSEKRSEEENLKRNILLASRLSEVEVYCCPALGRSESGDWKEESFAVVGLGDEQALVLAKEFEQNAIFKITSGEIKVLYVSWN